MTDKFKYKILDVFIENTLIMTYPRCVYWKPTERLFVGDDYQTLYIDVMLDLMMKTEYGLTKEESKEIWECYEQWLEGVLKEVW